MLVGQVKPTLLLKVYFDGKEIPNYSFPYRFSGDESIEYFSLGKFFLFIALDRKTGLKILYNYKRKDGKEALERVISIQKLIFENGLGFDCCDDVLEVDIKQVGEERSKSCYGYITSTDIEFSSFTGDFEIGCESESLEKLFVSEGIIRRKLLNELAKGFNYILTDSGPKFIDIDPKFHYV